MMRDMDIVRQMLLATAALPPHKLLSELPHVDGQDFSAHVVWLQEAGLVIATSTTAGSKVLRLTWQGCEFVDAIKNDNLWAKAKTNVMQPAMSFTFDLLKDWLKAEMSQGFPTLRA